MTDRPQAPGGSESRISELVDAGLIERRTDDLGRFVVQLTPAGEELARAVVDADATMDPEALQARLLVAATPDDDRAERDAGGRAPEPLTLKGSFGTALGSAMLGFEQALRREPPAEMIAAEHAPERGYSGEGGEVVLRFPRDEVRKTPGAEDPDLTAEDDQAPG